MTRQPAMIMVALAIRAARGVYAPGRLGKLTWQVLFELVDAVLAGSSAARHRLRPRRARPSRHVSRR